MNLNQFYYFNELAKQHQFSEAAKHLNISQPSLSNSIKSLEKELDCNLIEQKNGRIQLTKYSQIFLETSESVISVFEKTKRDIKKAKRGENNTIEIGCIPTATNTFYHRFFPYLINKIQNRFIISIIQIFQIIFVLKYTMVIMISVFARVSINIKMT